MSSIHPLVLRVVLLSGKVPVALRLAKGALEHFQGDEGLLKGVRRRL